MRHRAYKNSLKYPGFLKLTIKSKKNVSQICFYACVLRLFAAFRPGRWGFSNFIAPVICCSPRYESNARSSILSRLSISIYKEKCCKIKAKAALWSPFYRFLVQVHSECSNVFWYFSEWTRGGPARISCDMWLVHHLPPMDRGRFFLRYVKFRCFR